MTTTKGASKERPIHRTHRFGRDYYGNITSRCRGCNKADDSPGVTKKCRAINVRIEGRDHSRTWTAAGEMRP